ncbi:GntP family permease [Endozoicomonas arenosclerae]|uniref:GntP family permease n=1 Tax=Endozoicomonas arenosclerae TaxID=1633495 RepID=UPI000AB4B725|nr:GntP family permease [Endozoicomonas arenosclerae]
MDHPILQSSLIILSLIAAILVLIGRFKWPPFAVLLLCAYAIGLISGLPATEITPRISQDMGSVFGEVALLILFGVLLGHILEKSGGAVLLAEKLTLTIGERYPALAMGMAGYIISIPVYCDSGFILLNSIRQSIAQRVSCSPISLSVALGGGLFATHALVPPTPGPAAAALILGISPSLIIPWAMVIALLSTLAAIVWGKWVTRWLDEQAIPVKNQSTVPSANQTNVWYSIIPILLPLILMSTANFQTAGEQPAWALFLSQPANALFLGLLASLPLIMKCENGLAQMLSESIRSCAMIILIITAGGALAGMLAQTGHIAKIAESLPGSLGLLLPFMIAATFKVAQGSTTVALISAASMIEPLLPGLGLDSQNGRLLAILSAGTGSMMVTHANDSYFWVVTQFSGISPAAGFKSFTIATLIQALTGLGAVLLLARLLVI